MSERKIPSWFVLTLIFLVSLVLGVIGLMESGKRFLDACYLTMQLITLNAGLEDGPKPWQLEVARFVLPGIGAYAALNGILLLAQRHIDELKLKLTAKDHYVICGLGDRGLALARDLLTSTRHHNVVAAIDIDPNNTHIKSFTDMGGVFLEGDAREQSTLDKASISRAEHLILLTGTDAMNLGILQTIKSMFHGNKEHRVLKCHTHIANNENKSLFEEHGEFFPPLQKRIEYTVFNAYENAAIELFQTHVLGSNAETSDSKAKPVSLLIAGFGRMGEAVLVEAMQIGHFTNQVPISLTVLDDEAKDAERRFLMRYREVPHHLGGQGLNLWNLRFIADIDEAGLLGNYTDILSCNDDEDLAQVCIHNLWERWCGESHQRETRFFLHSPSRLTTSDSHIHVFGNYSQACSEERVIERDLETMARFSHEVYARKKLKDNDAALGSAADTGQLPIEEALIKYDLSANNQSQKLSWQSLSLLKRGSNFTEKRHYGIRLQALGLEILDKVEERSAAPSIVTSDYPCLAELDVPGSAALIASCLESKLMSKELLIDRLNHLARAEHNRWNAFHVLNNYRYGESKDEVKKTHDCLLAWPDLEIKKHDTIKYDYQNIYQMIDTLKLVNIGIRPST